MAQIDKPNLHFNTKLYTGNGSTQSITGVGFQPDFLWIKERSSTSAHTAHDVVRGATKYLVPNTTDQEGTAFVSSFDSDGFSLTQNNLSNENSQTYVSWNWKAGGAASSNTAGDINSSVSVNTTAGFSIVSYTGNGSTNQTVGHGLGSVPDFIIIKQRNTTRNWPTYSRVLGNGVAFLDITDAWNGGSGYTNYWYTSGMTTTTFGISNNDNNNANGGTYIAYCFAEKKGFSKFGKYSGNGNSSGQFVYTGFKPAFVIFKVTNDNDNWHMHDIERTTNGGNPLNKVLYPNLNNSEGSVNIDFLSNGFKPRSNNNAFNASGKPYIYLAFAKNPIVGSNNVPATAE